MLFLCFDSSVRSACRARLDAENAPPNLQTNAVLLRADSMQFRRSFRPPGFEELVLRYFGRGRASWLQNCCWFDGVDILCRRKMGWEHS